jgi:hypothetical protein
MLGADVSGFRHHTGFSGMPNSNPWADLRGIEPLPFGYAPSFGHPQVTNLPSIDLSRNPAAADASSPNPQAAGSGNNYETARRNRNSINIPHALAVPTVELGRASRAARDEVRAGKLRGIPDLVPSN